MAANSRLILRRHNKKWILELVRGKEKQKINIPRFQDLEFLDSFIKDFLYAVFGDETDFKLKEIKQKEISHESLWPGEIPEQNAVWFIVDFEKHIDKKIYHCKNYENGFNITNTLLEEDIKNIAHNIVITIINFVESPVKDVRQIEMFNPILVGDKND